jgi:hypothetical protein
LEEDSIRASAVPFSPTKKLDAGVTAA